MDGHLGSYADPLSLNRYTYCHNNPIRYRDPSGRSPEGNIQSAYNAWQGGYISYAQYAFNVWLNGGTPVANPNGSGINFGPKGLLRNKLYILPCLFAVRRHGKTLKGHRHCFGFSAPPDGKNPAAILSTLFLNSP